MKIILKEDVDNLGERGSVVEVKDGYGRNYLIPRKMAVVASKGNQARYAEELKQRAHKVEAERRTAEQLAQRLEGMEVEVAVRAGADNRIFGTVTTQQVVDALALQGYTVDRRRVTLDEEIRTTGVYGATVKVHPQYPAQVKLRVVSEEAAA